MTFRMTPKRWFWLLLGAALLWCGVGNHSAPADPIHPGPMMRTQGALFMPVRTLLIAPEAVFSGIEGLATMAIERVTARHNDGLSVDALQEQVQQLQAQLAQLSGLYRDELARSGALKAIASRGLTADDVLEANIVGYGGGPASAIVHLDKGALDGVRLGMAVVAPLRDVTVLGRVITLGQKECDVRLLSDPQMKVRADIVRNSTQPITEGCLIEGIGGGMMQCTTVDVQAVNPPQRGDFVRLTDNTWPSKTQYMLVGQIDELRTRENQMLRYDLRIAPLRPITGLRNVMIVTRE